MRHDDLAWPRSSGVLLHPTSLPSGTLGPDALRFVDFLAEAGQTLWQVLPLGPPGAGNSPYAARSAFAGNPALIAREGLCDQGLLPAGGDRGGRVGEDSRVEMLQTAFHEFLGQRREGELEQFVADQDWVAQWATFAALRRRWQGPWWEWPDDSADGELEHDRQFEVFCQYQFDEQWKRVRGHANACGIRVLGDIPIFVDLDSCDVWANRDLFKLLPDGRPEVVAGVPPDAFSATGQRWGNPVYDWDRHRETGFKWWVDRLSRALELADGVRLDHFRGFVAAWEVPARAADARSGRWVPGPGFEFFRRMEAVLGRQPIAVEDLGMITPDVHELREELGYPGMAVLQFAFGDRKRTWWNPHLPHRFRRHLIAYTGTHDNDTTVGWWKTADDFVRGNAAVYVETGMRDPARELIRLAQGSVADTVIIPFQDWLRLGRQARMNTPGTSKGNWDWHLSWDDVPDGLADEMRLMAEVYARLPEAVDE